MGTIFLESLQKILKLDVEYPYFRTYEEVLEFAVDGSMVKAAATISWLQIIIYRNQEFHDRSSTFKKDQDHLIRSSLRAVKRKHHGDVVNSVAILGFLQKFLIHHEEMTRCADTLV